MTNDDYNIIKPVENLQSIKGLTAAEHRKERKQRQNLHEQSEEELEQELNQSTDEETTNNEVTENGRDQHSIDYCA